MHGPLISMRSARLLILLVVFASVAAPPAHAQEVYSNRTIENAALFYYRAGWAEPLPPEKREALRMGTSDPEIERYFSLDSHQDALSLIRAAGKKNFCDWGIQKVDESGVGLIGILSRAGHILTDLPLDHFRYICVTNTKPVGADDIIAVFELATHLESQPSFPMTTFVRATILAKAVRDAAAQIGRIDTGSLLQLQEFIRAHEQVFSFRSGDALLTDIAYTKKRIARFKTRNPEIRKGEQPDAFITELGFSPQNELLLKQEKVEDMLALIERELDSLRTVAETFNMTDQTAFNDSIRTLERQRGKDRPSAPKIQSHKATWERYFSTSQRIFLFNTGLALVLDRRGAATSGQMNLPEGMEFQRKEDGFILRLPEILARGRMPELTFGGIKEPSDIPSAN